MKYLLFILAGFFFGCYYETPSIPSDKHSYHEHHEHPRTILRYGCRYKIHLHNSEGATYLRESKRRRKHCPRYYFIEH